jgi:hypothetical protein
MQVRKAAARKVAITRDSRRVAFTSQTGVVRIPKGYRAVPVGESHEHIMVTVEADLPGDRSIGYCFCGEYMDTGTWDERNA